MRLFILFVLSAYVTVYLHEIGHGFVAFLYGCKESPFNVTIDPLLVNSNDAPYKEGCWESLLASQQVTIALSGISSNIIFGSLFLLLLRHEKIKKSIYAMFPLLFVGLFSYLLATSYMIASPLDQLLVAENLYSDIPLIVKLTGINPLVFFSVGVALTLFVLYMYLLLDFYNELNKNLKIGVQNWKIFFSIIYVFLLVFLTASRILI